MQIWYTAVDGVDGAWQIRHGREINPTRHNHPPYPGTIGLIANYRRLDRTEEVINEIIQHARCGLKVAASLALLREQFPNVYQTRRDISNVRQKYRHIIQCGMTIDATLESLQR